MIDKEVLYSLDDISVIPAVLSNVRSRKECNPFTVSLEGKENYLPIITAPMDSVVDETCYKKFQESGISTIIPRTTNLDTRMTLCGEVFCAFGFDEIEEKFIKNTPKNDNLYVLIDVANGHMTYQIELGKKLKAKYGDRIKLMGGNIANPETYKFYNEAGFDYLRCGIGGGCFVKGTKILMSDGSKKPIEEIRTGEKVINSKGFEDEVIDTLKLKSNYNRVVINDQITCTENHKFYVVNKKDISLITDDNIHTYAFWISARELDKDKHMLVKLNV